MRIMDVQEFKTDQYENYRERRTSQFIKFLDKDVDFVTYFQINKNISTTSCPVNSFFDVSFIISVIGINFISLLLKFLLSPKIQADSETFIKLITSSVCNSLSMGTTIPTILAAK